MHCSGYRSRTRLPSLVHAICRPSPGFQHHVQCSNLSRPATSPFEADYRSGLVFSEVLQREKSLPIPRFNRNSRNISTRAMSTMGSSSSEDGQLPPLSSADFRAYNHMAEHMDLFHDNFRRAWTTLAKAVETKKRPSNMSLREFLNLGLQFLSHLELHHNIEEQHIFPHLATRMAEFQPQAHLIKQHEVIHEGMDRLERYLRDCKTGAEELRLEKLGETMGLNEEAGWGKTLWTHLDDEVRTLGAENMRKYWSKEEMRRMPM